MASKSWNGNLTNNWFVAGNWSSVFTIPNSGDDAQITTFNSSSLGSPVQISSSGAAAFNVFVENANALSLNSSGSLFIGNGLFIGGISGSSQVTVNFGGFVQAASVSVGSFTNGSGVLDVNSGQVSTSNLAVGQSGAGTLVIRNGGQVSANGFAIGTVTVGLAGQGNGTIIIGGAGAAEAGGFIAATTVNLATAGSSLIFNTLDAAYTQGSVISGAGSLTKLGTGTVTLTGNNNYSGATSVQAGRLKAGSNLAFGSNSAVSVSSGAVLDLNGFGVFIGALSGAGSVTNSSVLAVTLIENNAAGTTFSGVIGSTSGTLNFNKVGAGTLTLSGANTYTGQTTISAGTLAVANNSALGTGALTIANGAVLQAAAFVTVANAVALEGGSGTVDTIGNSFTLSGVISGVGGGLTKAGAGTLILSGANTYTGATTVSAGRLLANSAAAFSSGSAFFVNSGAALDLNGFSETIGALSGGGSILSTAPGSLPVTLTENNAAATLYSGVISNGSASAFSFTKTGAGTLTLSGANTYSGQTTISAGTIAVDNNSALGTGALAMANGVVLQAFFPGLTVANAVALAAGSGTVDTNGNIFTLSGVISGVGGGLTKAGVGSLLLSGANTYTGATTVSAGSLVANSAAAFSSGSAFFVNSGASLNLNGFSETIGALSGGGSIFTGALSTPVTLTENNAAATLFSGIISNGGSGVVSFTKTGAGTLTLSGANSYSGQTTISAGTLAGGAVVAFSAGSATTISSGANLDIGGFNQSIGSLSGAGNVTNSGAGATLFEFNAGATTFSGVIGNTGGAIGLSKNGAGTLTLSGANTYTGPTTVNAGTLKAGAGVAFSSNSAFSVSGGAVLDINGAGVSIGALSGAGSVTNSAAATASLIESNAAATTFSGVIGSTGGTLSFGKFGAGTLTLSGANTYTGITEVIAGTLALSGAGSIANSSVVFIAAGGTFDISGVTAGTSVGDLGGTGAVGGTRAVNLGGKALTLTNSTDVLLNVNFNGLNSAADHLIINVGSAAYNLAPSTGVVFSNWEDSTDTIAINGNAQANTITGSVHADSISGGLGNDTMLGGDDLTLTANQRTIYRLYGATLAREPDVPGLAYWISQMNGGVPLATITSGFTGSPEFIAAYGALNDNAFVTLLYANVLHRLPDSPGLAFWLGQLSTNAQTRSGVVLGFSDSPENQAATDLASRGYATTVLNSATYGQVFRLYGATLNRGPDTGGFQFWVDGVAAGSQTLSSMAAGFVGSPEFASIYGANPTNTALITLLYSNVLHRLPDAPGLAFWQGRMAAGDSAATVVLGFSESPENQSGTTAAVRTFMQTGMTPWLDTLNGGAGDDVLFGGRGGDTFQFSKTALGSDQIYGFETWDTLNLTGFGYANAAAATSHMSQAGADVVFADQGETITFHNTTLGLVASANYTFV